MVAVMIYRRLSGKEGNSVIQPSDIPVRRKNEPGMSSGNSMRDKLGDKVVKYLIEVSRSDNAKFVRGRIEKIQAECNRLSRLALPAENQKIVSTVFAWTRRFDIDAHCSDMKVYGRSFQITYNAKKRDFQLRIRGK